MSFSNAFLILARMISIAIVLTMGVSFKLDSLPFRTIFVGLLFSHFAMGLYYSKKNASSISKNKMALVLAAITLGLGLYFALSYRYLAPYFLVVHAALSDAYLLRFREAEGDEKVAIYRTLFYCFAGGLLFLEMPLNLSSWFKAGTIVFFISLWIKTENKSLLWMFELPLLGFLIYAQFNHIVFHFHYLGFYHISTWYVFSFWMLFVKERNPKKTIKFFVEVSVLSAIFILLFRYGFSYQITEQGFLKVIGFWSILHIFSSIPLSKFNPTMVRKLFYA